MIIHAFQTAIRDIESRRKGEGYWITVELRSGRRIEGAHRLVPGFGDPALSITLPGEAEPIYVALDAIETVTLHATDR